MKQSFYVYNDGEIKRKDNTLQFRTYEGEKRDREFQIFMLCQKCHLTRHF